MKNEITFEQREKYLKELYHALFDYAVEHRIDENEFISILEEIIIRIEDTNELVFEDATVKDAEMYIYQFPSELKYEDIETAVNEYNLNYLGQVGLYGFQPDDHVLEGSLENLKKFAEEYLSYELNDDYLYKQGDFDTTVIVNDSKKSLKKLKDANILVESKAKADEELKQNLSLFAVVYGVKPMHAEFKEIKHILCKTDEELKAATENLQSQCDDRCTVYVAYQDNRKKDDDEQKALKVKEMLNEHNITKSEAIEILENKFADASDDTKLLSKLVSRYGFTASDLDDDAFIDEIIWEYFDVKYSHIDKENSREFDKAWEEAEQNVRDYLNEKFSKSPKLNKKLGKALGKFLLP
jgi:hypothetical protein